MANKAKKVKSAGFVTGFGEGCELYDSYVYSSLDLATESAEETVDNLENDEVTVYELVPRRLVKQAKAQVTEL